MSHANKTISFQTELAKLSDEFGWHYIAVSKEIKDSFGFTSNVRRVVCSLNGVVSYQCGLMPKDGEFFIVVNKKFRDQLFHALTSGKQRTMLYYIGKWKDIDRRIHYALTIVEHLKRNDGKVVYKELGEELKRPMF